MTAFFVDTSALVKRYVNEIGSAWVRSWIEHPAVHSIVISELTTVELYSALARRRRDATLAADAVESLQNDFLFHAEHEYLVILLQSQILIDARRLVNQYPLRTLDALQLASAIHAPPMLDEPITFVSADPRLNEAAVAEGFTIDNPLEHT